MSRFHRRAERALPWLVSSAALMVGMWLVDPDLWRSRAPGSAVFLCPSRAPGSGNAGLWLRPMRGSATWMWWPGLLAAAIASAVAWALPWADGPIESLRTWPMSVPVLAALATYAGALRRARPGADERPLREVVLRAMLASATLILVARYCDADAGVRSAHSEPWFADSAARSVVRSAGFRITCHALVASLAPSVVLVHLPRPRARLVLLPVVGVGVLALGLLLVDGLELRAALALEGLVVGDARGAVATPGVLDGLSWLAAAADFIGVSALGATFFAWGLAVSVTARSPLSAARVGWADTSPLLATMALSTTSLLAPTPDGFLDAPASPSSLGADAGFDALVRPRHDPREPRALSFSGVTRGIGILTADGELRTRRGGLLRYRVPASDFSYPGRPWDRAAVEVLVDRRATLAQLVAVSGSLAAFGELHVGCRVRPELDSAWYARRRWGFLERASRAAAGWPIDLVRDVEACGPSFEVEGARYTRCALHDGEPGEVMVLRDPGAVTIAEWLDTVSTEDDWIAIEVPRLLGAMPRAPERVWPHDPPPATHQLTEAWPLSLVSLLLALVVSRSLARRGPKPLWVRRVARVLDVPAPPEPADIGPYRTSQMLEPAEPRASRGRRALALSLGSCIGWVLTSFGLGLAVFRCLCGS